MDNQPFALLVTGGLGFVFMWLIHSGLKRGEIEWPHLGLSYSGRRKDQPIRFWAIVGSLGLLSAILVLATLGQVYVLLTS